MELGLAVIGLIVTVVLGVLYLAFNRIYGNRRNVLRVDVRNNRIPPLVIALPDGSRQIIQPNPSVQFDVEIRIENKGPNDIEVSDFNGHSFDVFLGAETTGIQSSSIGSGILQLGGKTASIDPRRLPKGNTYHWSVRCMEQTPRVSIQSALRNVDIRFHEHREVRGEVGILGDFQFKGAQRWWRSRVRRF